MAELGKKCEVGCQEQHIKNPPHLLCKIVCAIFSPPNSALNSLLAYIPKSIGRSS